MQYPTVGAAALAALAACSHPAAAQLLDSVETIVRAQNPCSSELSNERKSLPPLQRYSALKNRAVFLVRPNGQVELRPRASIDENDEIEVRLVADSDLASYLRVVRKSDFGLPDSISIAGSGLSVPQFAGDTTATVQTVQFSTCTTQVFPLQDFAVGKGEVGIVAVTSDGPKTVGTFEFGVRRLYTGALSLAFVHTRVQAPTFGLTTRMSDGDTVITVTGGGRGRNLFGVFYTPFLWGRRDLQKFTGNPLSYLNPTFGLSLNEFGKNGMAGASLDIPTAGISLMLGWHAGRVNRIDPNSGYHVGDPFNGPAANIPLEEVWKIRRFVGVGLDLRAAAQFVTAAVGSGKTK